MLDICSFYVYIVSFLLNNKTKTAQLNSIFAQLGSVFAPLYSKVAPFYCFFAQLSSAITPLFSNKYSFISKAQTKITGEYLMIDFSGSFCYDVVDKIKK